jgi:signal transduction histidine kinase
MEQPVSFFNWSLKKLLNTESDTLNRARIKVLLAIISFSLMKISIAISVAWHYKQYFHLERAFVMLVVYMVLLKLLLADKAYIKAITHVMVWLGLLLIWSNALISAQTINIITLQFIFMLILSSFYLLNKEFAILYAFVSILPVILHLVFRNELLFTVLLPNQLASPGYEIIVVLNFITIIITHYLFQHAFISNIVEKGALNKQLELAVKEANEAAASKSLFLSTMSHELRTPLNSVIGMSELLLKDSLSNEQTENLKILKFSAVNLHSLINDILDFNKLGSDKLDLEAIPVSLYELMNDICSGLRFLAKQKGVDFVLDIDETLADRRIVTDPTRITQIIYNLAGNAIKFTEQGTVSVCLKVLSIDNDNLNIRFSVIDTGIGISADKQEAIFEPFTQASSSTTRNFGGTGLGLAIVKRLLVLFNSSINLESAPGDGSTFVFDISFKLDKEPIDTNLAGFVPDYDLSGLKILVAEDNLMNRLLMTKVFANWNNEAVFALNGREAIDKMISDEYDVVLMDLHMPVVDGYEAARAIRAISDPVKSSVRIIALTASVSANLHDKIKDAGIDDYVQKPFKLNELYCKLKNPTLKD